MASDPEDAAALSHRKGPDRLSVVHRSVSAEILQRIVDCGTLAPSGDNLQPWIVTSAGDRLTIEVDRSRDRSLYNYEYRASLIAVGAMVENMAIAARQAGLGVRVQLSHPPEPDLPVVTVSFEPGEPVSDPLADAMRHRCTNRKPYQPQPLTREVLAALVGSAPSDTAGSLRIVESRAEMKVVARAASLNDRLLFELRRLHDDLYASVRWTEAEADATRDGLFVKTLELGAMGPGFRMMRSWNVVRVMNVLGSSRLAPVHSYRTFMRSAALGFLTMADRTGESYVEGGRRLQRLWLTATSLGLAFQPMAGTLYMLTYLDSAAGQALDASHAKLLRRADTLLRQVLPLEAGQALIMLFRVGFGPAPSATSVRRSIRL